MSASSSRQARALVLGLALGAIALVGAGCGSSSSSASGGSTITVGAEPAGTGTPSVAATTSSTAAATTTVATPKSGPLSKEPKVVPPHGRAPKKLIIKNLIVGDGPPVLPSSTVTVNYVGVLYSNGKVFDASWNRGMPTTFPLSGVIPGWTQGLVGMKVGGRRELIIPPSLAYGATGSPPTIPPNATLVFVIDMLGVQAS